MSEQYVKPDFGPLFERLERKLGKEKLALLMDEAIPADENAATGADELLATIFAPEESRAENALWMRCALVGSFDRDLFEVLQAGLDWGNEPHQFDEFVAHDQVVPVPRKAERYRLGESERERYLEAWREPGRAGELHEFSRAMLAYYDRRGKARSLDALPHWIHVDQAEAMKIFETLYLEADEEFDVARCHTLLSLLTEHTQRFARELTEPLQEWRAYFDYRCLYTQEYYQTASYYEREILKPWLERLVGSSEKWIFHLYATGGMGKTTFLRWLISRKCARWPKPIPCARADFDFLDLSAVAQHPELLLLVLAEQLDTQIASRPFDDLRDQLSLLRLVRRTSERTQEEQRHAASLLASFDGAEIFERFAAGLQQAARDRPIILMLDTLEEAILWQQQSLLASVEMFAKLERQVSPWLRLILSGRYHFERRVPGFKKNFSAETEFLQLEKFGTGEAEGYLLERRGLPSKAPIRAIVARAEGNPFKLALFADLAQENPSLTAKEIDEYPRADFAYLIDRVVARLGEETLKWLIRYGSIPRDLTLDYAKAVIAPYLPAAVSGQSEDDEPERLPEAARGYRKRQIWKQDLDPNAIDLDALWERLRHYASGHGWISFEGDVGHFQPEVVNPMRRLLQNQAVHPQLQRDSVAYFEDKASSDSESWARWMAEAVFHRFHLEGADAEAYWHQTLEAPQARQRPETQKLLAQRVLRGDLVFEQREPLEREDKLPPIRRETVLEAHEIAARACRSLASLARDSVNQWNEARKHMVLAAGLRRDHKKASKTPPGHKDLAKGVELIAKREYKRAIPYLNKALEASSNDAARFERHLELGYIYEILEDTRAESHLRTAIEIGRRLRSPSLPLFRVRQLLGGLLAGRANYHEAEKELELALRSSRKLDDEEATRDISVLLVSLYLLTFRFQEAGALLADLKPDLYVQVLRARTAAAAGNPRTALELLDGVEAKEDDLVAAAAIDAARCRALVDLVRFDAALEALEDSKAKWTKAGVQAQVTAARLARFEIYLRNIGDLNGADEEMKACEQYQAETETVRWVQKGLLTAELLVRRGDTDGADTVWERLLRERWVAGNPYLRAVVLAQGFSLELTDNSARAKVLLKELRRIKPASARWNVLKVFESSPGPIRALEAHGAKLKALFAVGKRLSVAILPQALLRIELLRVLDDDEGLGLLERAEGLCRRRGELVLLERVLAAGNRWGAQAPSPPRELPEFQGFSEYRALRGRTVLEQAKRLALKGSFERAESALEEARRLFEAESRLVTRSHAELEAWSGRVAEELGRDDVAQRVNRAAALYRDLGDQVEEERIRGAPEPPEPEPLYAVNFDLAIREGPKRTLELGWQDQVWHSPPADSDSLLAAVFETTKAGNISRGLIKLLSSDADLRELSRRALPDNLRELVVHHQRELDEERDLRLGIEPGSLTAIPWEITRPVSKGPPLGSLPWYRYVYRTDLDVPVQRHRQAVKWIQTALSALVGRSVTIDGMVGPETAAAVEEFEKGAGLEPRGAFSEPTQEALVRELAKRFSARSCRALVVQPSFDAEISTARGYVGSGSGGGTSVAQLYAESDLDAHMLEDADRYDLEDALADGYHVVHVAGSFREAPSSGEILLDLGSPEHDVERSHERELSVSRFGSLIKKPSKGRPPPVIVLDVARPRSQRETIRQLLLRNLYAANLFSTRTTTSVVAMGLTEESEELPARMFIEGLAKGQDLGGIVTRIRKVDQRHGHDSFGRPATVLLSVAPWQSAMRSGKP